MSEIKTLTEELNKTIAEFKQSNNDRFAKLEKGEYVEPLIESKVNAVNKAITDIQNKINDAMKAEKERADIMEQEILNLKTQGLGMPGVDKELKDELKAFNSIRKPGMQIADVKAYADYKNALEVYMRLGDSSPRDILNAMSVGSDPAGGYAVPTTISSRVITKLFKTSPMRQVANIETIGTDEWEAPKDVTDGTSGGWVGETATRDATATPTLGNHKIPVHEQYAMPKATQKLLDDNVRNLEAWLVNKTSDKMLRTENTAFVSGNGVTQPRGFLDYTGTATTTADSTRAWGLLQYVVTGASGGFKWTDSPQNPAGCLIDIIHKMNAQYRTGAVWAMNSLTLAEVRKLRDAQGQYFFTNVVNEGVTTQLMGYPVIEFEDMDDIAANTFSIAFGNFNVGYQIVDRAGFRMVRDIYTDKPNVLFYMYRRVGGDVVNYDAIKLLKFGTS